MARINKLYTFIALSAGMATGSTLVNKIMKPDMTIPQPQLQKQTQLVEQDKE
ncbi:hypothetical protein BCR43DRAFT_512165 [Syncephalastrum racemosum]|uniref:Uncharacterized protein n=1 Tax=Syncephalastrum racemosum TaxID=13706 RepID=A0A1X2HPI7_SYNRA|nr:hypothetical protein BCR43DRAFT_512165 [Syncephalastrum racemosum]